MLLKMIICIVKIYSTVDTFSLHVFKVQTLETPETLKGFTYTTPETFVSISTQPAFLFLHLESMYLLNLNNLFHLFPGIKR